MKKKIFYRIFALLMITCLLVGCGEYHDALDDPNEKHTSADTEGEVETKPSDGEENEGDGEEIDMDSFSVTLMRDGAVYLPQGEEITARWTGSSGVYEAKFDDDGVAKVTGLDGDYTVTLTGLPSKYAYNPNGHTATNNNKNITIDIYEYVKPRTGGGSISNCISVSKNKLYRAELKNAKSAVFYKFEPKDSGTYYIESWVDVTADNVNPSLEIWGPVTLKLQETIDGDSTGVAPSGTYTKNFRYEISVSDKDIGQRFIFAVKATSTVDYPVTVDFEVSRANDYSNERNKAPLILPTAKLESINVIGHKLTYCDIEQNGNQVLVNSGYYVDDDGNKFDLWGLNSEDGYYHKYNEKTGKYDGELLFACITTVLRRFNSDSGALPLNQMESAGNSSLTVCNGTKNYKFFIEGTACATTAATCYFCTSSSQNGVQCPCMKKEGHPGYCVEGCKDCLPGCRQVTQEQADQMAQGGYADYANSDGYCAVTEELKQFLQEFSVQHRYFNDGNGWIDNNDVTPLDALDSDQWLWACAYYKGFTNLD